MKRRTYNTEEKTRKESITQLTHMRREDMETHHRREDRTQTLYERKHYTVNYTLREVLTSGSTHIGRLQEKSEL